MVESSTPSTQSTSPPLTISAEINAATRHVGRSFPRAVAYGFFYFLKINLGTSNRQIHTSLNRLITSRLPLGLPPYTDTPHLYAFGLRHFAHVYLTFESAWHDLCAANPEPSSALEDSWIAVTTAPIPSSATSSSAPAATDPKVVTFLTHLLPPGLPRSRRLRNDLAHLYNVSPAHLADAQLSEHPGQAVRDYVTHIRASVARKPWVLIAYAWVMYMAVFSGGRWIRAQLVEAGRGFWEGVVTDVGRGKMRGSDEGGGEFEQKEWEEFGLSFFYFDGEEDGEDVKAEFKRRLGGAETLLTEEQKRDVAEEAREIFGWSLKLVEELDGLLGTPLDSVKTESETEKAGKVGGMKPDAGSTSSLPVFSGYTKWTNAPGFAGLAVLLSCVSWYAFSHAGT